MGGPRAVPIPGQTMDKVDINHGVREVVQRLDPIWEGKWHRVVRRWIGGFYFAVRSQVGYSRAAARSLVTSRPVVAALRLVATSENIPEFLHHPNYVVESIRRAAK